MFARRRKIDATQGIRVHSRTLLALPSQLYLPADKTAQSCVVTDLSVGGASIACETPPPLSSFVFLHVQGFGRFEAVAAHFDDGTLGVRFVISEARRTRLATQIAAFLNEGVEAAALCGTESVTR
jgi:hypothetical protein